MIPVNLKLSNFTSYGADVPDLDFTKFHLAAISGTNGAGKSSILDAITWCLWGWSRSGDSADQLIRLGADEMQVEFTYSLDGHEFTVKRRRSKKSGGSTALEFWSTKNNLTEGTIKSTQEKIISSLHLTFETFINSSFIRQGHSDEFTTKGPNDRKRILADILGLSHYDELEEKAKEKVKAATVKLQLLDYQILEFEAELSQKENSEEKKILAEKKIVEVESQINILEKELKNLGEQKATLVATSDQQTKLKQTLIELQNELNEILTQGKNRADKIKILEIELADLPTFDEKLKELKNLEKQKEEYTKLSQQKLELENKLTQVNSTIALKSQSRESLEQKLKEIESHLEVINKDSAKCPTCGQIINASQKENVKKEYSEEQKRLKTQIAEIKTTLEEEQIGKLKKEIESVNLEDGQYKGILQKISELKDIQEKREKLIAAQATLQSEKATVQELRSLFTSKKTQVEKLELEVGKLPDLATNLILLINQITEKEMQLTAFRTEEKEARNLLGQATELISRVTQVEKVLLQKKEEKISLQKEKENFEELSLAFGKKGIQAMIIETAIPEIEDEANNLLGKLTNGRMKVTFETQRETKTKVVGADGEKTHGITETLDIIISDEMGERPYENYSGGEQFRVNVAIRLALSKLLTRRAGAKLQFLVIDEGFGTQDQEGRTKVVEVLDTIKNDFEKILVITHLEELKEEFPTRIEVSKGATGSTFLVVGA
jgi:DNA repair protein SbcC/Rad50